MKIRRILRNALLLVGAAVSATLEAPRVAHSSLGAAATELMDAPAAMAHAAARLVAAPAETHLGFDTNVYPGDRAMDAWRRSGAYEWVGYYLQGSCHRDGSWSGRRERLAKTGWGVAVIYVGQQTWGKTLDLAVKKTTRPNAAARRAKHRSGRASHRTTHSMARTSRAPVANVGSGCSASFVSEARGAADARDAMAKTKAEGFAPGTVIFLDIERMETIPRRMRDYYRAWTAAVLASGMYRPGIYAHTYNAATIFADVRDVYDDAGVATDPPFWIAGTHDFDIDKPPTDVGHTFAAVWQGMLDVVRTHNGVKLPIDISVASLASPSTN